MRFAPHPAFSPYGGDLLRAAQRNYAATFPAKLEPCAGTERVEWPRTRLQPGGAGPHGIVPGLSDRHGSDARRRWRRPFPQRLMRPGRLGQAYQMAPCKPQRWLALGIHLSDAESVVYPACLNEMMIRKALGQASTRKAPTSIGAFLIPFSEDIASRTERSRGVERPTNALRAHQPVSKARA
jgi:hypothetical protein